MASRVIKFHTKKYQEALDNKNSRKAQFHKREIDRLTKLYQKPKTQGAEVDASAPRSQRFLKPGKDSLNPAKNIVKGGSAILGKLFKKPKSKFGPNYDPESVPAEGVPTLSFDKYGNEVWRSGGGYLKRKTRRAALRGGRKEMRGT